MSDHIVDPEVRAARTESDGWTPTAAEVERIDSLIGKDVRFGPRGGSSGRLLGRNPEGPIVQIEAGLGEPVRMHCQWVEAETPELKAAAEAAQAERIAKAKADIGDGWRPTTRTRQEGSIEKARKADVVTSVKPKPTGRKLDVDASAFAGVTDEISSTHGAR